MRTFNRFTIALTISLTLTACGGSDSSDTDIVLAPSPADDNSSPSPTPSPNETTNEDPIKPDTDESEPNTDNEQEQVSTQEPDQTDTSVNNDNEDEEVANDSDNCINDTNPDQASDNIENGCDSTINTGIILPENWYFFGDSQTAGRASSQPLAVSHAAAFENLWLSNFATVPYTYVYGVGGRSLQGTMQAYENTTNYHANDWVHIQESGNQKKEGQKTPEEFINSFVLFVEKIISRSPNALITMETAYSFEREARNGRDWTQYNSALRTKVSEMQASGQNVYLIDVEPAMKGLVEILGFNAVILDDGGHYSGVGNLLIALLIFDELGYDVNTINLEGISDISAYQKEQCLLVINQL